MTTNTTNSGAAANNELPRDVCANCNGGCADGEDCATATAAATQATSGEADNLNGGMHASIFVKVWGEAGGGDAGRIALANYAYELGRKAALATALAPAAPAAGERPKHDICRQIESQLRQYIAKLEAENHDLRTALAAAQAPSATSVAGALIDTPEFLRLLDEFAHESGCEEYDEAKYKAARSTLIAHINAWRDAQLAAQAPAAKAEPVATVIKRGAERQWMSENLGSLPDGVYSLYIAPSAQADDVRDAVLSDAEIDALFDAQCEKYGQLCDAEDMRIFARAAVAAAAMKRAASTTSSAPADKQGE